MLTFVAAKRLPLLQSPIAGLITGHEVKPQLACALAGDVASGVLDVMERVAS